MNEQFTFSSSKLYISSQLLCRSMLYMYRCCILLNLLREKVNCSVFYSTHLTLHLREADTNFLRVLLRYFRVSLYIIFERNLTTAELTFLFYSIYYKEFESMLKIIPTTRNTVRLCSPVPKRNILDLSQARTSLYPSQIWCVIHCDLSAMLHSKH